jgi:hypothetical protein
MKYLDVFNAFYWLDFLSLNFPKDAELRLICKEL